MAPRWGCSRLLVPAYRRYRVPINAQCKPSIRAGSEPGAIVLETPLFASYLDSGSRYGSDPLPRQHITTVPTTAFRARGTVTGAKAGLSDVSTSDVRPTRPTRFTT